MTRLTCVFLVLLRLAIGWHFLFEGVEKLKSDAWSSEAYLRESTGPLAPVFHRIAGDSVADRLTPKPIPADVDTGKTELDAYFPPALEKEWQAWFDRFVSRYKLDDKQKEEVQKRFQQRKAQTVRWMLRGKVAVPPLASFGPAEPIERTVPEWLETYQAKLAEAEQLENTELRTSKGSGYERQVADQVRDLKDEANRIRAALRRDLNKQTKDMREALADLLTDEQWERGGPLSTSMSPGPLKWGLLGWADFLVAWGLTILGACLLLGLCTRTACVAGALLVLSFYLAMPPWPGLPENPKAEGHYLIVNKNIVEMFALLVLATTASGKWLGLDRLFRFLNRKNYRSMTNPKSQIPNPKEEESGIRSQEPGKAVKAYTQPTPPTSHP